MPRVQPIVVQTKNLTTKTQITLKTAPFKQTATQSIGPFANTTPAPPHPHAYPVKLEVTINGRKETKTFASSEHAFHALKLIEAMKRTNNNNEKGHLQHALDMLLDKNHLAKSGVSLDPREHFKGEIVDGYLASHGVHLNQLLGWDPQKWPATEKTRRSVEANQLKDAFMQQVLRAKFHQHPDLMMQAKQCLKDGIMPIEVSQHDAYWGCGKTGRGANRLGTMILEIAKEALTEEEKASCDTKSDFYKDPKGYYEQIVNYEQVKQRPFNEHNEFRPPSGLNHNTLCKDTGPNVWSPKDKPNLTIIQDRRYNPRDGDVCPHQLVHDSRNKSWKITTPGTGVRRILHDVDPKNKNHMKLVSLYSRFYNYQKTKNTGHHLPRLPDQLIKAMSSPQSTSSGAPVQPQKPVPPPKKEPVNSSSQKPTPPEPALPSKKEPAKERTKASPRTTKPDSTWHDRRKAMETSLPKEIARIKVFDKVEATIESAKEPEVMLKQGKIPVKEGKTIPEAQLDGAQKVVAAANIAEFSARRIIDCLDKEKEVSVMVVKNIRGGKTNKIGATHDKNALKIQFTNREDAFKFSRIILDSGVHSFTFGPRVPKTPQTNAIYLTADDLDKIAHKTGIVLQEGSGQKAYHTLSENFSLTQEAAKKQDEEPRPGPSPK